ncbi:hypothetical protein GGP41_009993 [Bipolaris sorokiniana]|uniref:Uncharacterized protein n=2 Tax=Cochliobolus sativus TaxID=45130 RepID=A0A8H5ZJE1_COCSA|nr:uncharacterized protein COCSADRAFT_174403 [Bipolaris sorokiniana ND90Pr]EMD61080.1 hypothetical protein COCSADRAFT_174403 [Bipolaris sorokiniana ND90Pr]KAF5848863.1 hypothetical protein GGP41_009993 [Bipolaris sorokiniana]
MSEPSSKRRRTHSPDGRASSPLRQPPRRPSFASPTKASLAGTYPNLQPSTLTPRLSASPRRRAHGDVSAKGKQARAAEDAQEASEESDLPNTPSHRTFEGSNQPLRGILFSSLSKRPPRAKNGLKQSPLKPKAPAVQSDDGTRAVEDGPVEGNVRKVVEWQPPDPEVERRKQEKARLQREVEKLESQVSRCLDEIEKEQRRGPEETLQPQERESLRNFITEISGADTEPEKPKVSSLLCSFLPFAAIPAPPPRLKQSDKPIPSHRPVDLADPLPYLEMFTSFKFSTRISLPRSKTAPSSRRTHQTHTIDMTGPQKLLTAQLSLTIDATAPEITKLQLIRLTPWAEQELGTFIRSRAAQKDLSNASWAINSYWTLAQKRAQYWHKVETSFPHLLIGRSEKDTENASPQARSKASKPLSRKELNRHLGRDTLVLQDAHVVLKLSWRIGFDWTGEAESNVAVEPAFPRVWSETDTADSLKKVPETFDALMRAKGVFEATTIIVALLFAQ